MAIQKIGEIAIWVMEIMYSDEDNRVLTTDAAGMQLLYSYDPYGRLLKVTDVIGKYNLAEKEYDVKGRLILERDVNGAEYRYTYDSTDRYTSIVVKDAQNNIFSERYISYDEAYRIGDEKFTRLLLTDGTVNDQRKSEYIFDYKEFG